MDVSVVIPTMNEKATLLTITMHVDRTFIPDETLHNGDKRQLGIRSRG